MDSLGVCTKMQDTEIKSLLEGAALMGHDHSIHLDTWKWTPQGSMRSNLDEKLG